MEISHRSVGKVITEFYASGEGWQVVAEGTTATVTAIGPIAGSGVYVLALHAPTYLPGAIVMPELGAALGLAAAFVGAWLDAERERPNV